MGLQATSQGIEQAKIALADLQLTQDGLAYRLGITRQPVNRFFNSKDVGNGSFVRICEFLNLDWKTITNIPNPQAIRIDVLETGLPPNLPELVGGRLKIYTLIYFTHVVVRLLVSVLVQKTREVLQAFIQEQCGTMRVLDMEQPIELTGENGIYTNVNMLAKMTRLRSEKDLLENWEIEHGDRFNLGDVTKTVPGLVVVQNIRRLMVLGKPGAGKSTFLKYLSMHCITGKFAMNAVPMFVTLKDFAEAPKSPSLVQYLADIVWNSQSTSHKKSFKHIALTETIEQLLIMGRILVLLDGLDEVREEDTARVIREIRNTADHFSLSQFVITCRIAAKEYTFERFTEVEVADFNGQQVTAFAENWFRARNDLPKAESFTQRLKENKPIQELASSPLLLTLLCLVFGEGGDFPSNRADLYEEGVKLLLKKWDAKRNIQRDDLYEKLDVQRREDLLSCVALQTFQRKEYFIKQRHMEHYIADFISNLKNVDPTPDSLRVDSEAVLRSIQAQHGLLVERARGIYSFSHLTFQEYFAAREIATTNQINILVPQIAEKRWREVFLLTVGILRNSDRLLLAMVEQINMMLFKHKELQHFLEWLNRKSASNKITSAPSAVRAYYFDLVRGLNFARHPQLSTKLNIEQMHYESDLDLDFDLTLALENPSTFNRTLGRVRARARTYGLSSELKQKLQAMQNHQYFKGQALWIEDLRQIMITHRNIGHDWKFTDDQKALLQQYYDANLFLVECLNSDCYVSRSVREEIEATLLLPVAEIEKLRMQN
jgi:predicted NACHT family NTPase